MKAFAVISIMVCLCTVWRGLSAQSRDSFVVLGVILDQDTREPLPYASLSVQNRAIGTIANEYGEFSLSLSKAMSDDTLIFSFVGYGRQYRPVSRFKRNSVIEVLLKPEPTLLNEVSVEGARLDANQIMERAVAGIRQNYPTEPFMLGGFFRELTQQEMKYVSLTEAVIRVFDRNFQRRLNHGITEDVSITQGRKSVDYADSLVQNVRKQNSIMDLLDNNPVHYTRGLLNSKYFDYRIDSILQGEHNLTYVISTVPGRHVIYVADSTYAILKTIEEIIETDTTKRPEFNLNDSLVVRRMVYFKAITEFQPYNGKMFLKYSNETDAYEVLYRSTRRRKFLVESYKELVVTHIIDREVAPFPKGEKYNFHRDIVSMPYEQSFWQNNPQLRLSPLNHAVQKDLEHQMTLPDQFAGFAPQK